MNGWDLCSGSRNAVSQDLSTGCFVSLASLLHLYLILSSWALQMPPVVPMRWDSRRLPRKRPAMPEELDVHSEAVAPGRPLRAALCWPHRRGGAVASNAVLLRLCSRDRLRPQPGFGHLHSGILSIDSCWLVFLWGDRSQEWSILPT